MRLTVEFEEDGKTRRVVVESDGEATLLDGLLSSIFDALRMDEAARQPVVRDLDLRRVFEQTKSDVERSGPVAFPGPGSLEPSWLPGPPVEAFTCWVVYRTGERVSGLLRIELVQLDAVGKMYGIQSTDPLDKPVIAHIPISSPPQLPDWVLEKKA